MEKNESSEVQSSPAIGLSKDEILFLINMINESTIRGIELPVAWSVWTKLVSLYKSM